MSSPYIGRLAPSPTGLLHLGHAATFFAAYTRARSHHGTLLLRNEDLDPQRSRPEFVAAMLEDLAWLGIAWQPPMLSQSERLPAYRAAFEQLLASGHIYPCTCTPPRPRPDDGTPRTTMTTSPSTPAAADPRTPTRKPSTAANYRFRVPDGETIRFLDANLGPQAFTAGIAHGSARGSSKNAFGDFLIWRRPLTATPTTSAFPATNSPASSTTPTSASPKSSAAPTCSNPPPARSSSSAPSAFPPSHTSTPHCSATNTASASPSATTPSPSAPSATPATPPPKSSPASVLSF